MIDKPVSPLRQRMIDDMTARRFINSREIVDFLVQLRGFELRTLHRGCPRTRHRKTPSGGPVGEQSR
jgi:hypothetical protein